jgi:multiple sugar transport system permease protein
MKTKHNEWIWAWFLVAPTMLGLFALNIIPIFQTIFMTFFKTGAFGRGNVFIGLENYRTLLADAQVWRATLNTLSYTAIVVPLTVVCSMLLAVLMNTKIAGRSIYRTLFFIPMVVPPAAVTMVWRWLYNSKFGLINHALSLIGIEGPNWITSSDTALGSICAIGIWSAVGYNMVLLLAGLQEIPKDYYEAAEIDGASPRWKFFRITLPLVSPTLFFVVTTAVISCMQVFDVIFMMVDLRNPAFESTQSLVYIFYDQSFRFSNKGYGATVVLLLLAIIMVLTVIQNRFQKKWVTYM